MSSTSQQEIQVLYVDDDPELTELLAMYLQREDDRFAIETATNAAEGLQLLAEANIDCVVSDYQMPEMDGLEFFKSVTEKHPTLPFILYTGNGSEKVASEAISTGVTDYLQKKSNTDHYTSLANRIINAVDAQRRDQKIEFFKTLQHELTELSIEFLRSEVHDIDTLINHTLEKLGTLVGADRTYVFDIDHEAETLSNTHEWCSEGIEPQLEILQDIPHDTLPWWTQKLKNFEKIVIPNVSELPPEAEAERETLQEQNINSLIVTPMISNNELVGFIGFDWVEDQGVWSDEFINILRMASELITTARNRKEREGKLQELKRQYETVAENFPDGAVFLIDTDLRCVRAGGEELNNVGLSPDDIEDKKPHALFPGDIADELCHYYEEALNGNANTFEQVYGGDCYQIQTVPVRTDGKVIDHVMAVSQNITERKQQIAEIQRLKNRLELAVEGAELGVWDWNMKTDEVEFNDQWAKMLGYTPEELEPHLRTWETRVHPDDIEEVRASLDAHMQKNTEYYDTEHRMRTADGEWKWVRDIGNIVARDGDDEPIRAVGIHLDIDESKQYQRELEEKTEELEELTTRLEEQYQTLFEEAPVMAVVTRAENSRPIIEGCNNQFAETLGFEPDTFVGTELAEFYTSDSREELIDGGGYERSLEGDFTNESRELVAADGEIVETRLRAVPRKDASGTVVGTLAMYIDITEREEIKRANERLEEFAGIVSHDLRNPLTVATGHLELARDDCESSHLEAVEQAHSRMNVLIEDLLTLARYGEAVTDTEAINLTTVVEACWDTVDTTEATLTIESDRTVVADEPRLKQLFENLIRNAVEHGGSTVTVTVGGLENGFYIEDDGPGVPEDDAEAVFEAGYSTNDDGTGFGLSIVQRIVEAHEWDIRVLNSSTGGARFEITGVELSTE
ncbi:PAS domain S-box protein [Halorubrum laminariae]|uniref:histidine kinase n=1 Tax=Halorubrum laminariae TaxID=1433523 RepID=A0ABD6C358_9EURY|nr:PAS domain S-box protein [Halorubrum laminariae]